MTRRRIYLCAGLYAEGPSDYEFLSPLIERLLDFHGNRLFPGMIDVGQTIGIDAPRGTASKRADRIAAAVNDNWDSFTLLVVHADGGGAPEDAREKAIVPGITLAKTSKPFLIAVECVPVREIEAWMLIDVDVYRDLLGSATNISLPSEPERELDPKKILHVLLDGAGWRRGHQRIHRLFGEEVQFESLRILSSFLRFEQDLCMAIEAVARMPD